MVLFRRYAALVATLLLAATGLLAAEDPPLTAATIIAKARAALAADPADLDKVKSLRLVFTAYDEKSRPLNATTLTLGAGGYRLQSTADRDRGTEAAVCAGRLEGWTAVTALKATEFAQEAGELGVSTVIYTDIATDGMLTGPNWKSLEEVLKVCPCGVIASGGVSGVEDVARLAEMAKAYPNLVGAIVGKALYEGRCDVAGLLKATGER